MGRYETNGGEVKDIKTGLIWARCSVGQTWDGETCRGEVKELNYNDAIEYAAGQDGWRMPTKEELASLVNRRYRPMINRAVFPGKEGYCYWTSSPYAGYSNLAWVVNFSRGYVYSGGFRHGYQAVRLVKGE